MKILNNNRDSHIETKEERFSNRLRVSTQKVHSIAEQTGFIRGFLRGTASHASYLQLLTDLLPVYEEMEAQLDRLSQIDYPQMANFHMPELYRSRSLRRDIDFIRDTFLSDSPEIIPSQFSINYVRRVKYISNSSEPRALAGHLYTRYLGDLSGGQILARIARNAMQLDDGRGLDFYAFPKIDSIAATKKRFRAALDCFDGNSALEQLVTEEAVLSFQHNIAIFNGLKGSSWRSIWRNLLSIGRKGDVSLTQAESIGN